MILLLITNVYGPSNSNNSFLLTSVYRETKQLEFLLHSYLPHSEISASQHEINPKEPFKIDKLIMLTRLQSAISSGQKFRVGISRIKSRRTMKLLTHNMLTSNIKGVKNGFPLGIEVQPLLYFLCLPFCDGVGRKWQQKYTAFSYLLLFISVGKIGQHTSQLLG